MALAPGTWLGPYEIVGPLGAGGMGEVYRATDTRLGRDVAIKVLPAEVATDADRLARFEREAKAVSALNHPNIVTLYETGTSDAGPYLVLEHVDGQSLRRVLDAGPMPVKRLLDLGSQIAAGLAKAHAAGIVHRDLKPDNVMVTADGFAKILDFGLARLVLPDEGLGDAADTATFVKETTSGVILGTLGYLSPEQAAGKPADYRADQFALGALLYELATATRPFKRATLAESLTATIREDPEPVRSKRPDLPAPLAWLIERCLAKNPDDRYASTKDLTRDLTELRDRLSEISKVPVGDAPGARRVGLSRALRWVLAIAAAAALVASTFVIARLTARPELPSYRPLTFQRGLVTGARFSLDGRRVFYSAAYGDGPSQVYVTQLDGSESKLLDLAPPGFLLGVSSKDELAILQTSRRDAYGAPGTLVSVPAIGGTPRPLKEDLLYGDWAADGERLVVVGRHQPCAFLNGPEITTDKNCGVFIRLSPVRDDVAFTGSVGDGRGVVIQDRGGKRLAEARFGLVYGLAWTRDGREVWLTASATSSSHDRALYALTRDNRLRLIARAPEALTIYDVSADGTSALIATGAGWQGINASTEKGDERSLDLNGRTQLAGLSADGTSMLLNEQREVGTGAWFSSTDRTNNRFQLNGDVARGLTADGKWALVQQQGKSLRLRLVPTGAGEPRDVAVETGLKAASDGGLARWSLDGRRMFLMMERADEPGVRRIYVRENDGPWREVTPKETARQFAVSPAGDRVAATSGGVVRIFSVDGRELQHFDDEHGFPVNFSDDGRLLLTSDPFPAPFPAHLYHRDLKTGRIEQWRTIGPADPTAVTQILQVFVSQDERSYVYGYMRGLNDLYLARGLR